MTNARKPAARPLVRVHCAAVPATLPADAVAQWIRVLPPTQRVRLARRLEQGSGMESLTVVALLASLRRVCRLPPISRLRWTARGKPHFPGGPSISLTHSRGFAACAVGPPGVALGIDLEPEGRAREAAIRLVAASAEQSALGDGTLTATGLWTAKEAVLKAAGAGLPDILKVVVRERRARFEGVDYGWCHYRPREGLLLAIATGGGRRLRADIRWPTPEAVFGRPGAAR